MNKIVQFLFKGIYKFKIPILIFWCICVIICCYPAIKFLDSTTMIFKPPENSLANEANKLVSEKFPESSLIGQDVIVIKSIDNSSVLTSFTEQFSYKINEWISQQEIVQSVYGYYLIPKSDQISIIDKKILNEIKKQFVSETEDMTIINIKISTENGQKVNPFFKQLRNEIEKLNTEEEKYYIGVTGNEIGYLDLNSEIIHSLFKMDIICIPIALLVLVIVVESISLLIIPLCTLFISFIISPTLFLQITIQSILYHQMPLLSKIN